jgi:hypothetical protein
MSGSGCVSWDRTGAVAAAIRRDLIFLYRRFEFPIRWRVLQKLKFPSGEGEVAGRTRGI